MKSLILCASAVSVFLLTKPVFATERLLAQEEVIGDDGYNKTYEQEGTKFKDRMKSARSTPVIAAGNEKGGFNLGIIGAFGPVYNAQPDSKSGMGFKLGVDPGFVIQGDFSRIEFGVEVAMNSFDWKEDAGEELGMAKTTLAPITFMPHVGWGHNMGQNLHGIVKVGFGVGSGNQLTSKVSGLTIKSESVNSTLLSAGYDVVYAPQTMQFLGGIDVTHHKFSVSSATTKGTYKGVTYDVKDNDIDSTTNLNFINLRMGLRIQF
jgi:hypothetical protein